VDDNQETADPAVSTVEWMKGFELVVCERRSRDWIDFLHDLRVAHPVYEILQICP